MPGPQRSSLLHRHLVAGQPSAEWLSYAETEAEFLSLLGVVNGTPSDWLDWVEARASASVERGVTIDKPIEWRLSLLWNGMIMLQEMKFLSDLLETALRQVLVSYTSEHAVGFDGIAETIPNRDSVLSHYRRMKCSAVDVALPPSSELMACFTFYQLTETMARNWKHFPRSGGPTRGFGSLFWHSRLCRDVNYFRRTMKRVRIVRNDIAHSRRLFAEEEAHKLLASVATWLDPLGIEVKTRVVSYRKRRPRFLEPLWRKE